MSADRVPGKRGRLPVRPVDQRFAIKYLHEYAALAPVTYPVDVSQGITAWGMLGNDQYGDCGIAAYEHERMLAGGVMTADQAVALYLAYTGGQDTGVVIAEFLLYLFRKGLIEGFAPVQLGNVDAVMQQLGRGVLLGVNLTGDANQLFSQGQPWTVANGETPDPREGHVILKVRSAAAGGAGTIVTWGANQLVEAAWQAACVEEAWAIVTKDDVGAPAYAALFADLAAISGVTVSPPTRGRCGIIQCIKHAFRVKS